MTAADRLRNMADKATPGPWGLTWRENSFWPGGTHEVLGGLPDEDGDRVLLHSSHDDPANARLIALAPDLARWAADAADALNEAWQTGADGALPGHGMLVAWEELLARLDTIGNEQ